LSITSTNQQQALTGRRFSGKAVVAHVADGTERFKKTSERKNHLDDDEDEEENQRLDQFGSWLENDTNA
jgi:HIV Tat-specific factor 1